MMDPLKKKSRLYEDIVQQFVKKLECGELKAGDKLPTERELVEQLGVSRTSIREALRAMELVGMIQSKVGEGTYIKHSGMDHAFLNLSAPAADNERCVLEVYDIRMLLETYSARMAARNRTEKHLELMREAIAAMKQDAGQVNRGLQADKQIHRTIAEAAGNSMLIRVLSMCSDMINSSIAVSNSHVTAMDIINEHQEIVDAIENHNEKLAERLMRAHIKRAYDRTKFFIDNEHP